METHLNHTARRVVGNHPALQFVNALQKMFAVRRQRNRLACLPDHLLKDIGVTRAEAAEEAGRAPWDVPVHWRG